MRETADTLWNPRGYLIIKKWIIFRICLDKAGIGDFLWGMKLTDKQWALIKPILPATEKQVVTIHQAIRLPVWKHSLQETYFYRPKICCTNRLVKKTYILMPPCPT